MKKMRILWLSLAVLVFILAIGASAAVLTSSFDIDWWVLSGGGAPSSGGNVELNGSLGQSVIGMAESDDYEIDSGYWLRGTYDIFLPLIMR